MKSNLKLILAAFFSMLAVGCYPYPENRPPRRHTPNIEQQKKEAADKAKAEEEKRREALERKKRNLEREDRDDSGENAAADNTDQPKTNEGQGDAESQTKPTNAKKTYPVARKVPGQEGFVLSPYNHRKISIMDDNGTPYRSGTLLSDPTYPKSEKKYFRVP